MKWLPFSRHVTGLIRAIWQGQREKDVRHGREKSHKNARREKDTDKNSYKTAGICLFISDPWYPTSNVVQQLDLQQKYAVLVKES